MALYHTAPLSFLSYVQTNNMFVYTCVSYHFQYKYSIYIPKGDLLLRVENFKNFTNFYSTSKVYMFILETVRLCSPTA